MHIEGPLASQLPGDLAGEILAVIVIDREGSQIAVAGEALHSPHAAFGQIQGFGNRYMPQSVGAHNP